MRRNIEIVAKSSYLAQMCAANAGTRPPPKISVLLAPDEAERFEAYCRKRGFKKSTLIARLIREYLDNEHFEMQRGLVDKNSAKGGQA